MDDIVGHLSLVDTPYGLVALPTVADAIGPAAVPPDLPLPPETAAPASRPAPRLADRVRALVRPRPSAPSAADRLRAEARQTVRAQLAALDADLETYLRRFDRSQEPPTVGGSDGAAGGRSRGDDASSPDGERGGSR